MVERFRALKKLVADQILKDPDFGKMLTSRDLELCSIVMSNFHNSLRMYSCFDAMWNELNMLEPNKKRLWQHYVSAKYTLIE